MLPLIFWCCLIHLFIWSLPPTWVDFCSFFLFLLDRAAELCSLSTEVSGCFPSWEHRLLEFRSHTCPWWPPSLSSLDIFCFRRTDCQDLEFSWWFSCYSTSDWLFVNGLAFLSGVLQFHYNGCRCHFCLFFPSSTSRKLLSSQWFLTALGLWSQDVTTRSFLSLVLMTQGLKNTCRQVFVWKCVLIITATCVLRGLSCSHLPGSRNSCGCALPAFVIVLFHFSPLGERAVIVWGGSSLYFPDDYWIVSCVSQSIVCCFL